MAKVLVTESYISDIADAIRDKNGGSATYKPSQMAAAITALPDPSVLDDKTITANGTYDPSDDDLDGYSEVTVNVPNSYVAGDEGKVVSNGALVAQTSRSSDITVNGTYDTTLNDEVTVNVSGGGGGVELLTRSEWNALTTAQKQAKGLVAIQDYSTGFERGVLVNGADYVQIGFYIPYSDGSKVICEAFPSNFNDARLGWGNGNNPIELTGLASLASDGSVYLPGYTSGIYGFVDLGQSSTPFTAYIVAKTTGGSSYRRIISAFNGRSSGNGIMLYGTTVNVSSWANDTSTGISSTDYFVGVIQFTSSGTALGAVINASSQTPSFVGKPPYNSGRYVTIGRTDNNSDTTNAEPTDMCVKYVAVVKDVDSQSVMSNNMANLLSQFITNE